MSLPPALQASFASGRCLPVLLLRVDLPAMDPVALLYGTGEISYDGVSYTGEDETFGVLSALTPPDDGMGDVAPSMSFDLQTPTDAASATLASPSYQGSRVRLYVGGLAADGSLIDVYLWFDGELDRPLLHFDRGVRVVEFDCVSGFEKFFTDTEGQRLADSSHQEIWPGEQGFLYVTGIARKKIWGPGERPENGIAYSGGSGAGGFGGGGSGRNTEYFRVL